MINHKKLTFIFLFIIVLSCNSNKEVEYYANGQIKLEVELIKGQRNGIMYEYFGDGKIKSKGNWKDGIPHGETIHYFQSGSMKSVSNWIFGKQEGITKKFYENGELKSIGYYKNGNAVNIDHFDNQSRLFERQAFDSLDRLIYIAKYDTLGNKEYGFPIALFEPDRDTINFTETYVTKIYFGLPLKGTLKAFTGNFREGTSDFVDSLEINEIEPFVFKFSYKPKKPGSLSIPFKFYHFTNNSDTLNVDGLTVKHGIYVLDEGVSS